MAVRLFSNLEDRELFWLDKKSRALEISFNSLKSLFSGANCFAFSRRRCTGA